MKRTPYAPLKQLEGITPLMWLAADWADKPPARPRRWFRRPASIAPTYEPYISTSFRPARENC